ELPRTRETLLVRLMGSGETLARAEDDLRALPADAWERKAVGPTLLLLRRDLPRMGIGVYAPQEEAMGYHQEGLKILAEERAAARAEARADARAEGRAEGLAEGRAEGIATLVRQFERKLGRALTEAERTTVRARLDTLGPDRLGDVALDLDGAALDVWLRDAG